MIPRLKTFTCTARVRQNSSSSPFLDNMCFLSQWMCSLQCNHFCTDIRTAKAVDRSCGRTRCKTSACHFANTRAINKSAITEAKPVVEFPHTNLKKLLSAQIQLQHVKKITLFMKGIMFKVCQQLLCSRDHPRWQAHSCKKKARSLKSAARLIRFTKRKLSKAPHVTLHL